MPIFPSVEWFQAVADVVNADPNYRHLGTCDANVGIAIGDRMFEVDFEAYDVTDVKELQASTPRDLDFTLVMPYERWQEMLTNIKQHGRAEEQMTLNSLDLEYEDEFAQADDYYRRDKFYRFNQSLQAFFDASAQIETQFADRAAVGA